MNNELKYLIKPGAFLIILFVMFILVINFGYNKIYTLYTDINTAKETQRLLGLKVNVLETVDEVLPRDVSFIDTALPSKGSILYGISQIKKLGFTKNLLITNLRASPEALEDGGISKNPITFDVEGLETDIYSFFSSFYSALPLMNLERIKIDKSEGVARATATVQVYSATLPEKIPALAEGVDGFTNSDIETLSKLSQFILPDFIAPVPSEGSVREDPFK